MTPGPTKRGKTTSLSETSTPLTHEPRCDTSEASGSSQNPDYIKAHFHESLSIILHDPETIKLLADSVAERVSNMVSTALNNQLQTMTLKLQALEEEMQKKNYTIQSLETELRNKVDSLEQYTRRNSIRIFNIPEKPNESTDEIVTQLAENSLDLSLPICDIDRSHRVGRKTGNRPRAIIVKFATNRAKQTFIRKRKMLKGTNITIKEDLTKLRLNVMQKAIEIYGLKQVWTQDGRIVIKDNTGRKLFIETIQQLNDLQGT